MGKGEGITFLQASVLFRLTTSSFILVSRRLRLPGKALINWNPCPSPAPKVISEIFLEDASPV